MPRRLAGARTLITGGAGLIGSHVADLLVAADAAEIVIFDNLSRGRRENLERALASKRVGVVEGDIRDRELLARHLTGIDVVFHLAAIRLTQCAEHPRLAHEVMADGTFNVIEAAVAAKVGRLLKVKFHIPHGNYFCIFNYLGIHQRTHINAYTQCKYCSIMVSCLQNRDNQMNVI